MLNRVRLAVTPAAFVVLMACSGTCGGGEDVVESSWYRAEIEGELGPIPFYLYVPGTEEGGEGEAELRHGSETLPAEHTWHGDFVELVFPHWDTTLEARKEDSGTLEGVWVASRLFNQPEVPLSAEPVDEPDPSRLFSGDAPAEVDVEGSWRTEFDDSGKGEIRLELSGPGVVEGTVVQRELSGGDFGNAVGNVRGDKISLARFDGQKAFQLRASVGLEGQMSGQLEFAGLWSERFHAVRGEHDADPSVVPVREHNERIDVPGLDDPRYEDKPVIVGLFGTWCTTCGDLAPVIRNLYERYRDQGLKVHGVAYEIVGDEDYIEQQIATYRERYEADWPIVSVPGELESQLPPELRDLEVLPITMFRNPDGTMHAIRAGFVSPASGEEHAEQVAEFEKLTEEIVSAGS